MLAPEVADDLAAAEPPTSTSCSCTTPGSPPTSVARRAAGPCRPHPRAQRRTDRTRRRGRGVRRHRHDRGAAPRHPAAAEGSTGAPGCAARGDEPKPLQASVLLYFDPDTHELLAYDRVSVQGLGETVPPSTATSSSTTARAMGAEAEEPAAGLVAQATRTAAGTGGSVRWPAAGPEGRNAPPGFLDRQDHEELAHGQSGDRSRRRSRSGS